MDGDARDAAHHLGDALGGDLFVDELAAPLGLFEQALLLGDLFAEALDGAVLELARAIDLAGALGLGELLLLLVEASFKERSDWMSSSSFSQAERRLATSSVSWAMRASSFSRISRESASRSSAMAFASILSCVSCRSPRSKASGMESISMRSWLAASSMRSMALSGSFLPEM